MPDDEERSDVQAAQMDAEHPQAESGPDVRVHYPERNWGNE